MVPVVAKKTKMIAARIPKCHRSGMHSAICAVSTGHIVAVPYANTPGRWRMQLRRKEMKTKERDQMHVNRRRERREGSEERKKREEKEEGKSGEKRKGKQRRHVTDRPWTF
eukprot:2217743-Rhodomonas_salina.5